MARPCGPRALCASVALLCLAGGAAAAWALTPTASLGRFASVTYTREDGLPQNGITALAGSPDGFLWVGTQAGLARFDGDHFLVLDGSNTPEMRDPFITALLASPDGSLWIGTRAGLLRRDANGRMHRWDSSDGLPEDYVRSLGQVGRGAVLVGTYGGGLVRFSERGVVPIRGSDAPGGDVVRAQLVDDGNCLWIGSSEGLFHLQGDTLQPVTAAPELAGAEVRSLAQADDGSLWVGTEGRGLWRIADQTARPISSAIGIPEDATVWSLLADRHGGMWVGVMDRGLRRVCGDRTEALGSADGALPSDEVWSLHEDFEGNLWIGTRRGLTLLKDSAVTSYSVREGLADELVRTVYQDRSHRLWVGTERGLDSWSDTRLDPSGHSRYLPSVQIRSLLQTADGAIWVGTRRGLFTGGRGGFSEHVPLASTFSGKVVNALATDDAGCLWVGFGGDGLVRECAGGVDDLSSTLPNAMVRVLHPAGGRTMWVGTEGGLAILDGDSVQVLTTADGLPSDLVFALYEDAQKVMWVGTSQGLAWVDGGRVGALGHREGLPVDLVFQILPDGAGSLWLSTQRGLVRVETAGLIRQSSLHSGEIQWSRYDEEDGMGSSECNGATQPAGWRTADGRLWFPTYKGISVVDPADLGRRAPMPATVIDRMLVDGRAVDTDGAMRFPPGAEEISIDYTAPSFISPRKLRFRYRLDGFHSDWVEAGSRRAAHFAGLGPGTYRFRVQATTWGKLWRDQEAQLGFEIEPRVWQTTWFMGLVAVIFLVSGPAVHRYRMLQAARRQQELEELVDERTAELAEVNRRLEHMASVDSLTGVANQRRFRNVLEEEWRRHIRHVHAMSLVLLDVDRFKEYNDHYGHLAGDRTLREVATAIEAAANRSLDVVARYGGEEFAVILPATDREGARKVADAVHHAVAAAGIPHEASPVAPHVTVSVGVATAIPRPGSSPDTLVAMADAALYRAKSDGRDRVREHEE